MTLIPPLNRGWQGSLQTLPIRIYSGLISHPGRKRAHPKPTSSLVWGIYVFCFVWCTQQDKWLHVRGSAWKTKTLMTYRQGREERIPALNTLSIYLGTFLKDGLTWTLVLVMFIIYFRPKFERTEERPEFSNIQVQFTPELVESVSEGVRFPGNILKMWVLRLCPRSVWFCMVYWAPNCILTGTLQWPRHF